MKELISYAQIDLTRFLPRLVPFEAGLWRCAMYTTGKLLPFMQDTYNHEIIDVNNIIIDNEELNKWDEIDELRTLLWNQSGWVSKGSVIYIRFYNWNPPLLYYSHQYSILIGFTNGSPKLIKGIMYRPGLLSSPNTEQSADAYTYDKMKFNSATVSIDNTNGQFDEVGNFFGNEFNILVDTNEDEDRERNNAIRLAELTAKERLVAMGKQETNEMVLLLDNTKTAKEPVDAAQYYISNITVGLEKADFHLKDKRERLSAKLPVKKFSTEEFSEKEFSMMDDNVKDKDMQEAYGRCFGVPGICMQGKQIKAQSGEPAINGNLSQYRFRFSSQISRVDRIQVKMTSGETEDTENPGQKKQFDGWTTVYQRKPPEDTGTTSDNWYGNYPQWKPGINPGKGPPSYSFNTLDLDLLNKGEMSLSWDVAKQGGKHENKMHDVRMDGVFNNPFNRNVNPQNNETEEFVTPLDIIKDIMSKYSNVPYRKENYKIFEIEDELKPLSHEIGILYDKPQSVYEAIEKLQSGGVYGFQFQVHQNKFTARLDNPNREPHLKLGNINCREILNLNEVEIDWNADLYGSYTDVEYAHNYSENSSLHCIDKSQQQKILDIHRVEKEWNVSTLLANKTDAEYKSKILLEDFIELCPLIKNIALTGIKWFNLRIYDTVIIDFSMPSDAEYKYPRNIVRLIEPWLIDLGGKKKIVSIGNAQTHEYVTMINNGKKGKRNFAGKIRCQILRINNDMQTGITTIDVRVRKEIEKWIK
ncbi:MAG: hypothetical protein FWH41_03025 [Treponema sp.]|nr:hypothetical protein [Treponema sp.]